MLQPQNATAAALQQRSNGGANPSSRLPSIAKPDGVSADTHDLVLKTMRGGEQWGERKKADDALVALRVKRLAELRARAAKGGADGAAAALVSEQLEDLDGERLTRCLCTMDAHDVVVVHVHANNNSAANSPVGSSEGGGAEAQLRRRGSALLDAALATLSRRHDAHRKAGGSGGGAGAGSGAAGRVHSSTGASGLGGGGGGSSDVKVLSNGDAKLSFARLSAVDAGVTARLDVVDEDALPALLVYRGGSLANSSFRVSLSGSADGAIADDDESGREREGEGGQPGGVTESDDLDGLADEVEDLLEGLGVYD